MNRLNEIEARATAATEGPWEVDPFTWKPGHPIPPSEWLGIEATGPVKGEVARIRPNEDEDHANAEFIAHARADVPALVAALRAVAAVHRPVTVPGEVFGTWGEAKQCEDCEQRWPCNTLDAIRRHLGEDQ